MDKSFFTYKGFPLVRHEDVIYYGNMSDDYVVMLKIRHKSFLLTFFQNLFLLFSAKLTLRVFKKKIKSIKFGIKVFCLLFFKIFSIILCLLTCRAL